MSKIVLARIDDRLIHGQVMTAWLQFVNGNRIIVIDDETANDEFLRMVMEMAVPQGIKFDAYTVDESIENLRNIELGDENIILLTKTPDVYLKLIESGIPIDKVVVGGMGANSERSKFYKNISASERERGIFKEIIEKGTKVVIRIVTADSEKDVSGLL